MTKPANSSNISTSFTRFSTRTAALAGSPWAFMFAIATIVVWAITGPWLHFSDTWQLVMNSWTDVVTFLIVFLLQNTQNRDTKAINLKLDEIIRASQHAENDMIDIEKLSDADLQKLEQRYERIRQEYDARHGRHRGDMRSL
jgi:low affinity Fe/Cu permease